MEKFTFYGVGDNRGKSLRGKFIAACKLADLLSLHVMNLTHIMNLTETFHKVAL